MTARMRTLALAAVAALALAACSTPATEKAADAFPDLSAQGYEAFECGTGDAIGATFQPPVDDQYRAECWAGTPGLSYIEVANGLVDQIAEDTDGLDITGTACPEDVLNQNSGIACRAVQVEGGGDDVLVRIVTVLADLEAVLAALPEEPTQEQIDGVIADAAIEVLIGTEPMPIAS